MLKTPYHFFIIFFLIHSQVTAFADDTVDLQNMSLEDLMMVPVRGTSKFDQKINDAPASVTVVTASEIQKYGYRTLADIMRSIRGITVSYDRNYSYAGLRGFSATGDYNSRFLLQIDGHRVNENIYSQALIGTESIIDVDLIEKVEIIRGSCASLYGSNAFFGVINIITKTSNKFGQPQIAASYGSANSYKGRLSYGMTTEKGFDLAMSGTGYYSKGQDLYYAEYNSPETSNGRAENVDTDKSGTLFGRTKYGPLTFESAYVSRNKNIPTGSFETDFNSPNTFTVDEHLYLDLKYRQIHFEDVDVTARLYFDNFQYDGRYSYDGAINKDTAFGQSLGSELVMSRPVFSESNRVTAGVEFIDNFTQNQRNENLEPYQLMLDSRESETKWSTFLQDEYAVTSWLKINAGLCLDSSPNFGSTYNPRFAAILQPTDTSIIKLIYGEALRPPNAYELYYEDHVTSIRPEHLNPERNTSAEAILEQRLFKNYRLTTGVFSYHIEDLIRQINDPATDMMVFTNAGEMTAKGAEIEFEGVWAAGFRGTIGYTYQEARDDETNEILVNSPRHIGKLNMIIPLSTDVWSLGTNIQYMSPRKMNDGTETDDVWVVNMNLMAKNISPGLTLSLGVYNLFDQKYKDPVGLEFRQSGIEQDGSTFMLKMVYTLY